MLKHKLFLVLTKFIPHIIALFYAIYTFLGFCGIDVPIFGYFVHVSLLPWIYFYFISFVFRYCYVHRLPLYYIFINELITVLDYYLKIPIDDLNLLIIHLLIIFIIISGYSYYYIKYKLKWVGLKNMQDVIKKILL